MLPTAMLLTIFDALGIAFLEGERPRLPTFREFVGFLLSDGGRPVMYNEHWRPQWLCCNVCHTEFKILGEDAV